MMKTEQIDLWGLNESERKTIKRVMMRSLGTPGTLISNLEAFVGELPYRQSTIEKLEQMEYDDIDRLWLQIFDELNP
jgi:hypothetical protein